MWAYYNGQKGKEKIILGGREGRMKAKENMHCEGV